VDPEPRCPWRAHLDADTGRQAFSWDQENAHRHRHSTTCRTLAITKVVVVERERERVVIKIDYPSCHMMI
jgi:hypothetical protein